MERLTGYNTESGKKEAVLRLSTRKNDAIQRLAEYEDIGLSPEEVKKMNQEGICIMDEQAQIFRKMVYKFMVLVLKMLIVIYDKSHHSMDDVPREREQEAEVARFIAQINEQANIL